jgi:hypothetical protein
VIGLASEARHPWLAGHGVIPVAYGKAMSRGNYQCQVDRQAIREHREERIFSWASRGFAHNGACFPIYYRLSERYSSCGAAE